jgi:hypothetical protein
MVAEHRIPVLGHFFAARGLLLPGAQKEFGTKK